MNNFEAASLISKIEQTSSEKKLIADFINEIRTDPIRQNDFFSYCKTWKLAPWINTQLERNNYLTELHPETIELFKNSHSQIKLENENRNRQAVRVLSALKTNNIDVIILKGNLFAHTIYHDTGYKRMNDFDMLIHSSDWEKIQEIYHSLGYIPLGFGWSGEKEKAAKFSHVGMSFISPDFSCILGSQWGLKSPTTNYHVDIEDAWQTAQDFDFLDLKVKQLSPEYNLLHLVLHMGIFKCGIRDCMDVFNLCLHEKINTEKFLQLIQTANATDKTFFTLSMSNICSGSLDELLSQINPSSSSSFILRRLRKRMTAYKITNDFQESYNDYFQDIEKQVIYFNIFPLFHKKLRLYFNILKMIFLPDMNMAFKLNDSFHNQSLWNRFVAGIKAPYFVFSLIAQEIGWKFTILLFIKLFVDLLLSLKNYIIKKESYFDFLNKQGINPKSITNVLQKIQ